MGCLLDARFPQPPPRHMFMLGLFLSPHFTEETDTERAGVSESSVTGFGSGNAEVKAYPPGSNR